MRKVFSFWRTAICLGVCATTLTLAAPNKMVQPQRYAPLLDAGLVQSASSVDGTTWAAWSYLNGAEYDIAVSVADRYGVTGELVFFGAGDGRDQLDPSLALDREGHVYLAFTDQPTGRILLTWFKPDSGEWATPLIVTSPSVRAGTPALRVVGQHLVLAYGSDGHVRIRILPLYATAVRGDIFNDGPDPIEKESRDDDTDDPNTEESTVVLPMPSGGTSGS